MSEPTCVFCQIIQKEAPASLIYEDEQVTVFLSNRPVNFGHSLVVPKTHYVNIYEIPETEAAYLFMVAKRITQAVSKATGVEAIRIVENNGRMLGKSFFNCMCASSR